MKEIIYFRHCGVKLHHMRKIPICEDCKTIAGHCMKSWLWWTQIH